MEHEEQKERNVVTNRKAFRDYEIVERREAGIELRGYEVKSIRNGKVNLSDSYAMIENGEVFLVHLHISPYKFADDSTYNPTRKRRLLLHKREIRKLKTQTQEKGLTLIPLRIYFKGARVKIELGTARGRKQYDKRDVIARKEANRDIERAHKNSPR